MNKMKFKKLKIDFASLLILKNIPLYSNVIRCQSNRSLSINQSEDLINAMIIDVRNKLESRSLVLKDYFHDKITQMYLASFHYKANSRVTFNDLIALCKNYLELIFTCNGNNNKCRFTTTENHLDDYVPKDFFCSFLFLCRNFACLSTGSAYYFVNIAIRGNFIYALIEKSNSNSYFDELLMASVEKIIVFDKENTAVHIDYDKNVDNLKVIINAALDNKPLRNKSLIFPEGLNLRSKDIPLFYI